MSAPVSSAEISAEYLAGFVDGEGHLGIERINNGKLKEYRRSPNHPSRWYNRSPEHTVRVQVSNTNLDGLKAIQRNFGGSLTVMKSHRPRNKQAYKLTWNSRAAERILQLVGPYLVLKRQQYLLLLEFMRVRQKNMRMGGSNGPLDPVIIELRDDFHRRLKALNRRGVEDPRPISASPEDATSVAV
jgi:hypothetical protein